jgi:hypothetical protein
LNINKIGIFILLCTGFGSCDIIHEPYMETDAAVDSNSRKVLLEEFTGHQCPNCPSGSVAAGKLQEFYGDKCIIISYHTGFYARTSSAFPVDYRTSEGAELDAFFKVPYYPSGMINRTNSNNTHIFGPVDWSEMMASQMKIKPDVSIKIATDFIKSGKILQASVTVKALKEITYKSCICVYLTEDSLVSPQSISGDTSYPAGIIPDYNHMHVFRSSLNGVWGEPVFESGTPVSGEKIFSFSKTLDEKFDIKNGHIIVFVYKENDKSILQANLVRLIK